MYSRNPTETRLIFDVVEKFFTAATLFHSQFEMYESKVAAYVQERGLARTELRLTSSEVASLFDFKALEQLRDRRLFPLKELSHELFRRDAHTDPFDRYVSDLFHELSILKEEHYTVQTYGPAYEEAEDTEEWSAMLDEVHEFFPRRLRVIRRLFQKAQARLLSLLPDFRNNGVLLRSLMMYGQELVSGVLPGGLTELLNAMCPDIGAAGAYCESARRFLQAGFETWAGRCLDRAEEELRVSGQDDPLHDRIRRDLQELRMAVERRTAEYAAASSDGEL
ncbi:MAG: hypothetical protein ACYTGX_06885 [Planctomycetota bacterium]